MSQGLAFKPWVGTAGLVSPVTVGVVNVLLWTMLRIIVGILGVQWDEPTRRAPAR